MKGRVGGGGRGKGEAGREGGVDLGWVVDMVGEGGVRFWIQEQWLWSFFVGRVLILSLEDDLP